MTVDDVAITEVTAGRRLFTMAERDLALAELLVLVRATNHIVAGMKNTNDMLVELDERLRKDPSWVARHLAEMVRRPDTDVIFSAADLANALHELGAARVEIQRALTALKGTTP
jgi:hypothetical protein